METRFLGNSGFKVPVLGFGAGTFGGKGPLFSAWGNSDVAEAKRLIDICLDAGANFFDTADVYSDGASEEILGAAIRGRLRRSCWIGPAPRWTSEAVRRCWPSWRHFAAARCW